MSPRRPRPRARAPEEPAAHDQRMQRAHENGDPPQRKAVVDQACAEFGEHVLRTRSRSRAVDQPRGGRADVEGVRGGETHDKLCPMAAGRSAGGRNADIASPRISGSQRPLHRLGIARDPGPQAQIALRGPPSATSDWMVGARWQVVAFPQAAVRQGRLGVLLCRLEIWPHLGLSVDPVAANRLGFCRVTAALLRLRARPAQARRVDRHIRLG